MMTTVATTRPSSSGTTTLLLSCLVLITISLCSVQYLVPLEKELSNVLLQLSKQEFQQQKGSAVSSSRTKATDASPASAVKKQSHDTNTRQDPTITTKVNTTESGNTPNYHVVFSTSCTDQQNWESMVFFYHAYKVKQPGTVTRIASGCQAKEAKEQTDFFNRYIKPMRSDDFHLHLTPDYSSVKLAQGHPYKYMNKPYGLRHWMEHSLRLNVDSDDGKPSKFDDDIVILMDPDMILLRPLTHDFSDVENHLWAEDHPPTRAVRHGFPMAQQDGYLNNQWMGFDVAHITNRTDFVPLPAFNTGKLHWNSGPPYLATVRDMYKIAVKWTEYVPRVLDIHPQIFGEMYGLIHSTVQLGLPFTLLKSIVVSTTTTGDREGWKFVDALADDQVCHPPTSTRKLPIVLHYCERYFFGKMFFSKYRVKKNIMNCEKALLLEPVENLTGSSFDYYVTPPRADLKDKETYMEERKPLEKGALQGKREYFMLCGLTRALNQALTHHKALACGSGSKSGPANLNRTYTVYDDPTNY